jgi:ribose transport system ATP-binding protein
LNSNNYTTPMLEVRKLSKTFLGQRALSAVDLDVLPGEIHALVGENGSGKSTLIKCLAGYHEPDSGAKIRVDGRELTAGYGPSAARAAGFSFMHQDLGLIPSLSVLENLALEDGFTTRVGGSIRWAAADRRARELLRATGHDINPKRLVRDLSLADQALVAAARVMGNFSSRVIVFDEPTATLTSAEIPRMFAAIRAMAARGAGVLYVSHRLGEVLELCDRVSILRDGLLVFTGPMVGMDEKALVGHICGTERGVIRTAVPHKHVPRPEAGKAPLLRVTDLSGHGVRDATFELRAGEIVGIAGLLGSGRTELARLLFGLASVERGAIELHGNRVQLRTPADAIRAGLAFVSEDRRGEGAFLPLSVRENVTIMELKPYWRGLRIRKKAEVNAVSRILEAFKVRPAKTEQLVQRLSGGNQQKVVIGRWMQTAPRLLILDEPMQGIDIGAKAELAQIIEAAAADGAGVLLIDSDMENLLALSTRIIVMSRGRLTATLESDAFDRERILNFMYSINHETGVVA